MNGASQRKLKGGDIMAIKKNYYLLYYKGQLMGTFSTYRDAVDDEERLMRLWKNNWMQKIDRADFEIRTEFK